jgi:carbonic anhydrase
MDWLEPFTTNAAKNQGYLTYEGTVTTPPCTDDVTWVVMKTVGNIGTSQVGQLKFPQIHIIEI